MESEGSTTCQFVATRPYSLSLYRRTPVPLAPLSFFSIAFFSFQVVRTSSTDDLYMSRNSSAEKMRSCGWETCVVVGCCGAGSRVGIVFVAGAVNQYAEKPVMLKKRAASNGKPEYIR